jgi:hypothetical protein
MRLLSIFLALAFPGSGQIIEGSVTNAVTGVAVRGVAVAILSSGKPQYQTTTDFEGFFRIDGVQAGSYTATFTKEDFLELEATSPARRLFKITAASDPVHLEAKLMPKGKIFGRVLDGNGDPVPQAEVMLDSVRFGQAASSDNNGVFSFTVAPGRYTLLAKPPATLKLFAADEMVQLGWVPTYYPGVIDPRAAVTIVLNAGAEMWGNDVRLKSTLMRHVRGIVLDVQRHPVAEVTVRAARADDAISEDVETISAADGSFDFSSMYDGEWSVFVEQERNGVKLLAATRVMVGDRDLEGLELRLSPPFPLSGKITVDGVGKSASVKVFLRPLTVAGSQGMAPAVLGDGGVFQLDRVYPGTYKVLVNGTASSFLSSVKVGSREILGQFLEFFPGSPPIEIAFESQGGDVRGKVENCSSAAIVLVPQDASLRDPQFIKSAQCREDGRFELRNVRPGDYYGFAFDRWEGPLDLPPTLDQNLLNNAVAVNVKRGDTVNVALRITRRDP